MSGARTLRAGIAAVMLVGMTAGAQARCDSATDQAAFDVGALKSELSVLAVGCSDEEDYNRFVERDRSELLAQDAVVNAWFKRVFGRAAQARYDSYITLLANEQGLKGQHEGSDFCPRLKVMFAEAAVVPVKQLAQYAAAKDLIPKDDLACDVTNGGGASTTARSSTRSSRTTARHRR